MVSLALDRTGRLVSLMAVPPQIQKASADSASAPADPWSLLFAEAGLPIDRFSVQTPERTPPVFADTRKAWAGAYPERPDVPIRIEAAAAGGKPVYFEIVAPWTSVTNEEPQPGATSGERISLLARTIVSPVVVSLGVVLALRNLRSGRGDRRGALRVSLFLLAASMTSFALETGDLQVLSKGPQIVFFVPAAVWLLYIALEPHMRRIWPAVMFGWSRLLAGHFRDPLVGRDVLVGVMVAIGNALIVGLLTLLRQWAGRPPPFPVGASADPFSGVAASSDFLLGGRFAASRIIGLMTSIPVLVGTMAAFLLLLVLFAVFRRRSVAIAAMVVVLTAAFTVTHGGWILPNAPADYFRPSIADVMIFAAVQAAILIIAVRFGLLTMLIAAFVSTVLIILPITIDSSVPYASSSRLALGTVIVLAVYGWHTALGGRPMFGPVFAVETPLQRT
jgi:serine/threonine-protein kinase